MVTLCSLNRLTCKARCERCCSRKACRFCAISITVVLTRAASARTPASRGNGKGSKGFAAKLL